MYSGLVACKVWSNYIERACLCGRGFGDFSRVGVCHRQCLFSLQSAPACSLHLHVVFYHTGAKQLSLYALYNMYTRSIISNFRRVVKVVFFLLGDPPASECYVPTFRNTVPCSKVVLFTRPMKMEQAQCLETSAYKIHTPWNHPKETIKHKMCILFIFFTRYFSVSLQSNYNATPYLLTDLLTPWCRVLLEKLTGLQLVKKFPAFHGTRRFITALTSVRHLSLSWASPIQSIYPHPTSWRSVLILFTHLRLGFPNGLLPSGFPSKTLYTPLSSPIRATCPEL